MLPEKSRVRNKTGSFLDRRGWTSLGRLKKLHTADVYCCRLLCISSLVHTSASADATTRRIGRTFPVLNKHIYMCIHTGKQARVFVRQIPKSTPSHSCILFSVFVRQNSVGFFQVYVCTYIDYVLLASCLGKHSRRFRNTPAWPTHRRLLLSMLA